ncbi:MAG: ABC transporter ATP-binding protein [Clostridia bacterium]|nr:ABC transporter ATP-binding protein [Clostridia bacterium]
MLTAENIGKSFRSSAGPIKVLHNINFSIEPGTLTILRGRSGSGKTTLMNILGLLDVPTEGKVFLNGQDLTSSGEDDRDEFRRTEIGFVFQSVALISRMSALENIDFSLRIASYDPDRRKSRTEECLHLVGLSGRMHHRPGELSGGERQRIAIARAIAHQPKILFADEPTSELDTHMSLHIVRLFKHLVAEKGTTVIMTTHDAGMLEIADKVLSIEDGEIRDGE